MPLAQGHTARESGAKLGPSGLEDQNLGTFPGWWLWSIPRNLLRKLRPAHVCFPRKRTSTVNIICGLLATRSCMMACDEQFQPQPTLGTSPTPQLLSPLSLPRVQRLKFQEEPRPTQWNVRSPGWKNWHKQYLGQLQAMDNACWVFYTLIDEKALAYPLLFPNSSSQCFKHFGARELAKRRSKNIAMKKHPDSSPSEKNKQKNPKKTIPAKQGDSPLLWMWP